MADVGEQKMSDPELSESADETDATETTARTADSDDDDPVTSLDPDEAKEPPELFHFAIQMGQGFTSYAIEKSRIDLIPFLASAPESGTRLEPMILRTVRLRDATAVSQPEFLAYTPMEMDFILAWVRGGKKLKSKKKARKTKDIQFGTLDQVVSKGDRAIIERYISQAYLRRGNPGDQAEAAHTMLDLTTGTARDPPLDPKKHHVERLFERVTFLNPILNTLSYLQMDTLQDTVMRYVVAVVSMTSLEDVADASRLTAFRDLQLKALEDWTADNPELLDPETTTDWVGEKLANEATGPEPSEDEPDEEKSD
jgi:hypothetical protein